MLVQVYCSVYRTRDRGIKLPFPQQPVAGELRLDKWGNGSNNHGYKQARLLSDNGKTTLVPSMMPAEVKNITAHGIEVHGTEVIPRGHGSKSNVETYPQVWWCLVHTTAMSADLQEVLQTRFMPE